jgi:hypothetical protein
VERNNPSITGSVERTLSWPTEAILADPEGFSSAVTAAVQAEAEEWVVSRLAEHAKTRGELNRPFLHRVGAFFVDALR